jgi:hypothetical protein
MGRREIGLPNFPEVGKRGRTNFVPSIQKWTGAYSWTMLNRSVWEPEIMN